VNGIFDLFSDSGAGIGCGYTNATGNFSGISNLVIENGRFTLRGNSAGIGSGNQSWIDSVRITGGEFLFDGSAGIDCRSCHSLILGNSSFDCSGISCLRGRNITLTDGPLIVRTAQSNFAEFENVAFSGNLELLIEYFSTSDRERLIGLPIIHIEQFGFPFPSIYKLYISPSDRPTTYCSRSFTIDSWRIRGVGFSVPSETGYLVHDSIDSFPALSDSDTLYSKASFFPDKDSVTPCIAQHPLTCPIAGPATPDNSNRIGSGLFVAIVAGVIVLVLCLAILVIWRRRRARSAESDDSVSVTSFLNDVRIS
jgi:hypothetical protein